MFQLLIEWGRKWWFSFRFSAWNLFKSRGKKTNMAGWKPPYFFNRKYIFNWWIFHWRVGFRVVLFGLWTSCHFLFMLKKVTNISSNFLGAVLTEEKLLPSDPQHYSFRFPSLSLFTRYPLPPILTVLTVQAARPWWKNSTGQWHLVPPLRMARLGHLSPQLGHPKDPPRR